MLHAVTNANTPVAYAPSDLLIGLTLLLLLLLVLVLVVRLLVLKRWAELGEAAGYVVERGKVIYYEY